MTDAPQPQISQEVGSTVVPDAEGKGTPSPWEAWQRRLKADEDARTEIATKFGWETNVKRYLRLQPMAPFGGVGTDKLVQVPKDFANVEQKRRKLFFKSPELIAEAKQPGLDDAVIVFMAVVNKMLTKDMKVMSSIREVLFDVLCPAGIGAVKIGYEAVRAGDTPVIDPVTQQPAIDPTTQQPAMKPNIVFERYFQSRISPMRLGIPEGFEGSDFDTAPYLWFEYDETIPEGSEASESTGGDTADHTLNPLRTGKLAGDHASKRRRYEVWFHPAVYPVGEILDIDGKPLPPGALANPETIARLQLIKGQTEPAAPPDCPYQRFDANGRLIGGITGNPIRPLTLRYVSDSAYPPSDVWETRELVDELSKSRSLMLEARDRSLPMNGYDATSVMPADIEKITRGKTGAMVGFNGMLKDAVWSIVHGEHPRENFSFNDILSDDIINSWALRQATDFDTKTATEAGYQQQSTDDRMDGERSDALTWHVDNVEKVLAPLIQLFADEQDYIRLEGQDAQRLGALVPWNKTMLPGRYAWSAKPDSQIRVDAASDRKYSLDYTNYMAKSPVVNQEYLAYWLSMKFGVDPTKMLKKPEPPPQETPSVTWSIKMEDFLGPAAPIATILAQSAGIVIPPQVLADVQTLGAAYAAQMLAQQQAEAQAKQQQGAQPEHGGPADKAELLNKRQSDQTRGMEGTGTVIQ